MCYRDRLIDGSLMKNIRFFEEFSFFVQYLQRAEHIVAVILFKGIFITHGCDRAKIFKKSVIQCIQLSLFFFDFIIGNVCELALNQFIGTISDFYQTSDAIFSCLGHFSWIHYRIFTIIYCIINNCKAIVFHILIGRNGVVNFFIIRTE